MGFKEQLDKIKDNWFLILIGFIIIIIFLFTTTAIGMGKSGKNYSSADYAMSVSDYSYENMGASNYSGSSRTSTFSPEEIYRQVIRNASMGIEIKAGKFKETDSQLKTFLTDKGAFILKENINTNTANTKYIYTGSYTIKVKASDLDSVIEQLKTLGTVTNLNQGADDVTGQYTNNKIELETEKQRLLRYKEMYTQATTVDEKINLNDRIFNQERTIGYLEDSLKSIEERVDYSTINLTVREKSNYIGIVFVKFSELVRAFVVSINTLLYMIAAIFPWAIAAGIIYFVIVFIKKRNKSKRF